MEVRRESKGRTRDRNRIEEEGGSAMRRNQPQHREDALSILHGHRTQADALPQEFTEFGYWIDRQLARLEARYYRAAQPSPGSGSVLVLPEAGGDGIRRIS